MSKPRLPKTSRLTLQFEDGTQRDIDLHIAVEIDVSADRKQSVEFREFKEGKWLMSFTKPLFEGKKIKAINFTK